MYKTQIQKVQISKTSEKVDPIATPQSKISLFKEESEHAKGLNSTGTNPNDNSGNQYLSIS